MITVYLCEDNKILLQKYKNKIYSLAQRHNTLVTIKTFISGEQLLFYMERKLDEPDIVYMDVLMGKLNGIETAKKLRASGCQAELIFLSSSEKYVFDSFDASPLHYIVKDNTENIKFEKILLCALTIVKHKNKEFFVCRNGGVSKRIPVHAISHFEVHNRITTVFYNGTSFNFYSTIEKLEQEFADKAFVRCHRSILVSLNHIDEMSKNRLITVGGINIPIGAHYLRNLKLSFSSILTNF